MCFMTGLRSSAHSKVSRNKKFVLIVDLAVQLGTNGKQEQYQTEIGCSESLIIFP